jgi:hypothetical protein
MPGERGGEEWRTDRAVPADAWQERFPTYYQGLSVPCYCPVHFTCGLFRGDHPLNLPANQ